MNSRGEAGLTPPASDPTRTNPRQDPIRLILWTAAAVLGVLAAVLISHAAVAAATATVRPFLTLAAIILAAVLADRLGAFALLERYVIADHGSRVGSCAAILAFTALLSGLVNLDVAVLVAMPVALRVRGLATGRLALSIAATANATSFLLPTSNVTNLLLLGRVHLSSVGYLADSWLPWLLVTLVTLGPLTIWSSAARRAPTARRGSPAGKAAARVAGHASLSPGLLSDLLPLYLIASAIRALAGAALTLHGGFPGELASGSAIASVAGNLPAAAAMLPTGTTGLWATVLAASIGPNLLITGSVATLITRRIAADDGARLSAWQFSAAGLLLVPAQFGAAALGLHVAGVLR